MPRRHLGPLALIGFSILLLIAFSTGSVGAQSETDQTPTTDVAAAIQALREAKQNFFDARRQAANLDPNLPSAERQTLIATRTEKRKATILRILDVHQKHVEGTKTRVEGMPNITDEQKQTAVNAIDQALAALAGLRQQVEAATTDAQLRTLGDSLRTQLQAYQTTVKAVVQAIHRSRLATFLEQAASRAASLDEQLAGLAAQGQDVTALQNKVTAAQDLFATVDAQAETGDIREAVKTLKQAYALLRDVAQGIQSLSGNS